MKAMVLTAPGELVLDEVAQPGGGAGQVLVRVTHSGICGTDYKIFNGSIPVRYPRIMGHEMVGEVVDAGDSDAPRPATGSSSIPSSIAAPVSTAASARRTCARTASCSAATPTAALPSTSPRRRARSSRCPTRIDSRTAPMIQVLTTCLHAQRQVDIFPGEYVVVLGSA